jgi:tetratricopeptide (TPR) repeat protein
VPGSVKAAEWLRQAYPPPDGPDGGWLGSLAPDRLAERLVVAELGRDRELAARCLTELDGSQALRAVTLLGRASADDDTAAGLLERLLTLVEQVVAGLPDDLGLLTAISDAIPYPSTSLAGADLAVTRRILALLPPGQPALRARWLTWLGVSLAQTGQIAQALPVAEEAVTIRRELAAASPDRYRSDLATSLTNLGVTLSELGRPAEALPVTEEAVVMYRELAAAYPDRYGSELARSLRALSQALEKLGRTAEADATRREANDQPQSGQPGSV